MSIRAVLFDLGGVIVRTEYQAPRQRLAESLGMDYEDIDRIVFGGGTNGSAARATLGQISEDEHWLNVMTVLKQPASERVRIKAEFFAGDIIDHTLLDYLRSLRPKYKTGLISNAWSGLRNYIQHEKFDDAFDHMIISSEVGAMKPSEEIFHLALKQVGVKPNEAVFVDDFIENIEACEKVGMKGIHFRDAESAMKQLKAILK
jgi:epoxide hydrolase-like predicted phosphatase